MTTPSQCFVKRLAGSRSNMVMQFDSNDLNPINPLVRSVLKDFFLRAFYVHFQKIDLA